MKKAFALLTFLAVLTAGITANASITGFSSDSNDYALMVLDGDGADQLVFYGLAEGDFEEGDLDEISLVMAGLVDGDPIMENDLPMEVCEELSTVGSSTVFRCLTAGLSDSDISDLVGFFGTDPIHLRFEVGAVEGPWILGRAFNFDILVSPPHDDDSDVVPNDYDNCKSDPNFDQLDSDGDGFGDACDSCEGATDTGNDADEDGIDDACDPCPYQYMTDDCEAASSDDDSGEEVDEVDEEDFDYDEFDPSGASYSEVGADGAGACALAQSTPTVSVLGLIFIGLGLLQIATIRRK